MTGIEEDALMGEKITQTAGRQQLGAFASAVLQKRPIHKAFRDKMKRTGNRHIVSITGPVMSTEYKKDIFVNLCRT